MVPGIIMLILMMIPAMMTAVGVVREKELGSITNFYATPRDRARVPARQAVALRRHRPGQLRHALSPRLWSSACRSREALPALAAGALSVRDRSDRLRHADLGLRQDADRRDLRDGDHHHASRHAVLRLRDSRSRLSRAARGRWATASPVAISSRSASAPSPRRWASPICWFNHLVLAAFGALYLRCSACIAQAAGAPDATMRLLEPSTGSA